MRTGDKQRYGEAFLFEAFAYRLALPVPGVDALQDDGQLEVAERHVIPDPGHVPPGEPGILGGELGAGPEPGAGGGVGRHAARRGLAALAALAALVALVAAGAEPAFLPSLGPVDEG